MQSALINVMTGAALKAGKGLLRDFGEVDQLQVSRKGTANFVTQSDIRTEKLLCRELSKVRPDYSFLLEEGGEVKGKDAKYRWIIDPLDGTTNFIHAIPYFCISIGLEERNAKGEGEIIAGVIYDPVHNELFSAEKGKGAFLNGKRLVVSTRDRLEDALLVAGSHQLSSKAGKDNFTLQDKIIQSGAIIRYFGAFALDLANVAAGRIDACWHHNFKLWDIAAGMLLVQEAGGIITDLNGVKATLHSTNMLASNRQIHLHARKLLFEAA